MTANEADLHRKLIALLDGTYTGTLRGETEIDPQTGERFCVVTDYVNSNPVDAWVTMIATAGTPDPFDAYMAARTGRPVAQITALLDADAESK